MTYFLRIVEGKGIGAEFPVPDGGEIRIGRAADADIKLLLAEVSRQHCVVRSTEEGLLLVDEGSRGGTWVDGARVLEYRLAPGARFKTGPVVFEVVAVLAEHDAPTPEPEDAVRTVPDGQNGPLLRAPQTQPTPPPGFPEPSSPEADLLFGEIAVARDIISREDLNRALAVQEADAHREQWNSIGAILNVFGLLTPEQIAEIVAIQSYANDRDDQRRFGLLALKNGFITGAQLEDILAEQRRVFVERGSAPALGEMFLQRGLVTRQQVTALLAQQDRLGRKRDALSDPPALVEAEPADLFPEDELLPPFPPDAAAEGESLMGHLALERGYITAAQLHALLEAQENKAARGEDCALGELARSLGLLTDGQVHELIAEQDRREQDVHRSGEHAIDGDVVHDPRTLFGRIAVKNRLLSRAQVDECLSYQEVLRKQGEDVVPRIGHLLVERGFLRRQEVKAVLKQQQRMRSGERPSRVSARLRAQPTPSRPPMMLAGIVVGAALLVIALVAWSMSGGTPRTQDVTAAPPGETPTPSGGVLKGHAARKRREPRQRRVALSSRPAARPVIPRSTPPSSSPAGSSPAVRAPEPGPVLPNPWDAVQPETPPETKAPETEAPAESVEPVVTAPDEPRAPGLPATTAPAVEEPGAPAVEEPGAPAVPENRGTPDAAPPPSESETSGETAEAPRDAWRDFSAIDRADRLAQRITHTWYNAAGDREREEVMNLEGGRVARRSLWKRNTGEEEWLDYRLDSRGRVSTVERYFLGDVVERRNFVYLPDGRVKKDVLADGYAVLKDYRHYFYRPDGVAEIFDEFAKRIGKETFDKAGNPLSTVITADPARGRGGRADRSTWERVAPIAAALPTGLLRELGYRIRRDDAAVWFRNREEHRAGGRLLMKRETFLEDSLPARGTIATGDDAPRAFTFSYVVVDDRVMRVARLDSAGIERETWLVDYRVPDGD